MRSLVTREPQSQSRQAACTALSVRITLGAASGAKITLPQNRYMKLGVPSPANRRRCTPPGIQNRHGAVMAATLTTITCNAQLGLKQLLRQRNPQEKVSRSPGGTPNKMDLVTESPQVALLIAPITTFLRNGSLSNNDNIFNHDHYRSDNNHHVSSYDHYRSHNNVAARQ